MLSCGIVPGLGRCGLEVPDVFAGIRAQRHDGREKQVVALPVRANLVIPGATITNPNIKQVQFRIIGHGIPDRTTATNLPPLASPGFGGHRHGIVFKAISGVARHSIEAPGQLAGFSIISRYVSAHPQLGATITDNDLAINDARRTSDGITLLGISSDHRPGDLTALAIQCN